MVSMSHCASAQIGTVEDARSLLHCLCSAGTVEDLCSLLHCLHFGSARLLANHEVLHDVVTLSMQVTVGLAKILKLFNGIGMVAVGHRQVFLRRRLSFGLACDFLCKVGNGFIGVGHQGLVCGLCFALGLFRLSCDVLGIIDEFFNHGHDTCRTAALFVCCLCNGWCLFL